MPRQNKPVPRTQDQIINDTIVPYDLLGQGNPNVNPVNRGNDISVRGDTAKDVNIGLIDLYDALKYYIENIIKPVVIENGAQVIVPVEYAYGERWNEVQKNGFLRDKEGRVLLPMIIMKRDSVVRNRALGNKLDGNRVHNYQAFQTQYTRKNQYDNFAVLTNRIPVKRWHISPVPDYVIVTYNASILTNSQEQADDIIQAFNFAADAYWGQANRFKFKVNIESFTDTIEYNQGEDRSIRSNFNIVMNGYLLPDSVNRDLATQKRFLSKAVIKFDVDLVSVALSKLIPNVPKIITNDFLVDNGIYLINSNGVRINVGPQVIITNDFLIQHGLYLINSNGLRINVGPQITPTFEFVDSDGSVFVDSDDSIVKIQ